MVDIHCHILPGVDDGAQSMEEALEMARMAAESGVRVIAATPHCNIPGNPRKNYATQELADRFAAFREAMAGEKIPVEICSGAEVLCTPELDALIRKRQLPTLGGSRYLLTEFFFDESLDYMESCLECVASFGLIPVVAHLERYQAVQMEPQVAEEWFGRGYILQLNKGSILGRLGRQAARTANWLLEEGLAHVVASDGHSPEVRTPYMSEIDRYLRDICAPEYVDILLTRNPMRILQNQKVV